MAYGVIYKITNQLDGKSYVGQTTRTIEERFKEHAKCKTTYIGNAIRAHGVENFSIEVIEECDTREQLNEREIFWIVTLNCKHPNGYNLTEGGDGSKGFTEEALSKMRTPKSSKTIMRMIVAQKKIANTPEGKAKLDEARALRWKKEKLRPFEERGWIRKCRKSIFPIIEAELRQRKIKYATLAKYLNITPASISRKLQGKVRISLEQQESIKKFLNVNMSVEELFKRSE
ncbi:MAG: GIY-YIG nuclease family protein [Selenomonadaceae bacterium]|nr:GIY-YIG nuclease family protein [Selenomonadaceae bacterium]